MIRTGNCTNKFGSLVGVCASNKTSSIVYPNGVVKVNFGCTRAPRCGVVVSQPILGFFAKTVTHRVKRLAIFRTRLTAYTHGEVVVFAKAAVLPRRAPRNLHPALIVNIWQVGC